MKNLKSLYKALPLIREIDRASALTDATRAELVALRKIQSAEIIDRLRTEKSLREGPLCLHRFEQQVCSQNGEDGVTAEIFRRIGEGHRRFAEIGVGDGVENNTAFLHGLGWTGHWVDATAPTRALRGEEAREIQFHQAFVTRENIASQFTGWGVPTDLDLLSIDIDQNTPYIWEALQSWRARVVIVEYNAAFPASVDWITDYGADRVWDGSVNFGASLKRFEIMGRQLGYSLVHCEVIGSNAFFVRSDLLGDKFQGPFDAETHYEPFRLELIYRSGHRASRLDPLPPG
jgi:hypothetical protein